MSRDDDAWHVDIPINHPTYNYDTPPDVSLRIVDHLAKAYEQLPMQGSLSHKLMPSAQERTQHTLSRLLSLASSLPLDGRFERDGQRSMDPVFLLWKWARLFDTIDVASGQVLSFANGWCPLRITSLRISWAVVTDEALRVMCAMSDNFIDLGAGSGYLAFRLTQAGAKNVIAIDELSDADSLDKWQLCHPCVQEDYCDWMAREARSGRYDDYALVFSWPRTTHEMLRCIQESGWCGKYVAVIAEDAHDSGSIECLVRAGTWKRICRLKLPNWRGARDRLIVYKRIATSKL